MRGWSSPPQNAAAREPWTTVTLRPSTSISRSTLSARRSATCRRASRMARPAATPRYSVPAQAPSASTSVSTCAASPWKRTASWTTIASATAPARRSRTVAVSSRRTLRAGSGTFAQPPQLRSPLGIQALDPLREVRERDVAVGGQQRLDVVGRARLQVLVAREGRHVAVATALPVALQHPLVAQPGEHGHDRRVRALLVGAGVERVADLVHGAAAAAPHLLHDLALEIRQRGRNWPGHAVNPTGPADP